MPFVVGILATELNEVLTLPMDEVLIINIDDDTFIRTPGTNDINALPQNYIDPLKNVVRASSKVVLSLFYFFYLIYFNLNILYYFILFYIII